MEFTAHASSSAGNLYTVSDGESRLVIDPGVRPAELDRALGWGVSTLAGCLVSHHHGDHARAVGKVMKRGVTVYASLQTLEHLRIHGYHRTMTLVPLREVEIGSWRVLPLDLRHDADGALGFLIGRGDDRLLYACDTGWVPYRFTGLTHIAVEANYSLPLLRESDTPVAQKRRVLRYHMGIERVLDLLEANDLSKVREIWLLHLSDRHSDAQAFRDQVACQTGIPTYVARRDLRIDAHHQQEISA